MEFNQEMFLSIFNELDLEEDKKEIVEFVSKNSLYYLDNYEIFMSHPYFTKAINKYNEINNTNIKTMENIFDLCIMNEQNKMFNSFMSIEKLEQNDYKF